MAQSKNNVVMHGMSGMIGDMLVFRQRGGKTIVSNKPKQSNEPPSAAQNSVRSRFQEAAIYGSASIKNPALQAEYAEKATGNQTAFNVAVADFFNAPDIKEIDFSGYHGHVGDLITISVTDDFKVTGVQVKIINPDSSLVEEGAAVAAGDGQHWIFTATEENSSLVGDKIIVTATDQPHNVTVQDQTLS